MTQPKVTAEDLLLWLGANGPQFPGEIAKHFRITSSRVYTLLKRDWFVNEDKGRNLSRKGKAEYAMMKDSRDFHARFERIMMEGVVPWDVG